MKLITTAIELESEFIRLTRKYKEFYWSAAWASTSPKAFSELIKRKEAINKIVIGTHFYQTHPDFIEAFLDNNNVRFIKQPDGTFHPKLYLFLDSPTKWELIIGSANFTNSAFTKNIEASVLLSNRENNSEGIFKSAKTFVEGIYDDAKVFDKDALIEYRKIWEIQQQKIKSLSGKYGGKTRKSTPLYESEIGTRTWKKFIELVNSETSHGLTKRLRVMEIAKQLFEKAKHFNQLTEDERKFLAGAPNNLGIKGAEYWGYFGSMKGNGVFVNKIIENDILITKALSQIPLLGYITKNHFQNFLKYYDRCFEGTRLDGANKLSTATRLLCMKRPDTFICFDSKNKSKLCKDFGIVQSGMNYQRYWDDIIERIYDSEWWQNPYPKNEQELKVNDARAAFLDSLYYEE